MWMLGRQKTVASLSTIPMAVKIGRPRFCCRSMVPVAQARGRPKVKVFMNGPVSIPINVEYS